MTQEPTGLEDEAIADLERQAAHAMWVISQDSGRRQGSKRAQRRLVIADVADLESIDAKIELLATRVAERGELALADEVKRPHIDKLPDLNKQLKENPHLTFAVIGHMDQVLAEHGQTWEFLVTHWKPWEQEHRRDDLALIAEAKALWADHQLEGQELSPTAEYTPGGPF